MAVRHSVAESAFSAATPRSMPGLTDSSSSRWGASSIMSRNGYHNVYALEGGLEGEPLRVPQTNTFYPCLFRVLECTDRFDDRDQWRHHVTSHFRGQPPPTKVACMVCQAGFENTRPYVAWENMLGHVINQHFQEESPLASATPGMDLMHHLFCLRVISPEQYRLLQVSDHSAGTGTYHGGGILPGAAVGPPAAEPVYMNAGRRREQRMMASMYSQNRG